MRILSSAPGRAGIVGNPTDGYGGTVISASLAERATVEIVPADELVLEICGERDVIRRPADLQLTGAFTDMAKAALSAFPSLVAEHRFHLSARTEVPMRAGLAGSTAMLVAILGGLLRRLRIEMPRYEIAETARRIEFERMGITCGFQDHYMAVCGGFNCVDFRGKGPNEAGERVYATVERLETMAAPPPLVLANTGIQRNSDTVHKGLRERWLEGDPEVVEGYVQIARLARRGKVALLAGDWAALGAAMNENHAIQRDLGGSGEANERLIATALGAGSLGAKLAGAGKGGTIIALHPNPEQLIPILEAAGAARVLPVCPGEGLKVEEWE